MKNILNIENLSFNYENLELFKNLNLVIKEGSFITILGSSGSGKTTLIKILKNELKHSAKTNINVSKKEISFCSDFENIKFFQDKVEEELKESLRNYKLSTKEIKEKIEQLSKELNIKNLLDCSTKYLSASEKQIIALTKALINNPKVLILDDSMLLMDNKQRDLVFKYLKKINTKNKITIINLTSNVEDSIYGKQIAILNNGEIMTKDKKEKVLEKEKDFKQANLNLPFIADLSIKLGYYGLLNKIVLDKNKMVDILWK